MKFKLKDLKVNETSLVDKGAGKGVRIRLFKRRAPVTGADRVDVELRCRISKWDAPKRQVFGWFSVVKTGNEAIDDIPPHTVVTDHHDHVIDVEDLEAAAYGYMLDSRVAGEQHEKSDPEDPESVIKRGDCIESVVFTEEKQAAMGLEPGALPIAWWGGHQVDADTFAKVVSGELQEFSIAGTALKVPIEAKRDCGCDDVAKGGKKGEDCVGAKIKLLVGEGYDQKQAEAIAINYCQGGKKPHKKERTMPQPKVNPFARVLEKLGVKPEVKKDMGGPKTCGQMMMEDEISEGMYQLNRCFVRSMYSILEQSSGADQVKLMKQSVGEYGDALEKMIPKMSSTEKALASGSATSVAAIVAQLAVEEGKGLGVAEVTSVCKALGEVPVGEPTKNENKENVMKRTPAQIVKALSAGEQITDEDREVLKANNLLDEPAPTPKAEDVTKNLDPKVAELVTKALAAKDEVIAGLKGTVDKLSTTVEKLSTAAADQADKTLTAVCEQVAKKYVPLGYKAEDLAKTLKALKGAGGDVHDEFVKGLDVALTKAKAANRLVTRPEIGDGSPDSGEQKSAYSELRTIAKKIAEEKKITVEKAMVQAIRENPDLYLASTDEQEDEVVEAYNADDDEE